MFLVVFSEVFESWLNELDNDEHQSVLASLNLLQEYGYNLARPYADTIKGSKINNLKELRIQHDGRPLRAFFVFDPIRQAIILCAGDKTGDKHFYKKMIPLAETLYKEHLESLDNEKTNNS